MSTEVQKATALAEYVVSTIDVIHKLQLAIRECYARIEQLEKENDALRLRLAEEQESVEF